MNRDPKSEVVTDDNRKHVLSMGPIQPKGLQFPQTSFGGKKKSEISVKMVQ